MTGYLPNWQKKNKLSNKRETELIHAIKHDYSYEKVAKAAEKLREAKLGALKAVFSRMCVLPASAYKFDDEGALKWKEYTVDEIIDKYKVKAI